jgi:hypothetical protein
MDGLGVYKRHMYDTWSNEWKTDEHDQSWAEARTAKRSPDINDTDTYEYEIIDALPHPNCACLLLTQCKV